VQEAADNPSELTFAEHDNVVEAFPAQRPDYSFMYGDCQGHDKTSFRSPQRPYSALVTNSSIGSNSGRLTQ
jgi:hypothetical protein